MNYIWNENKIKMLKLEHLHLLLKTQGLTKEDKRNIKEQLTKIKEMQHILNPPFFTMPNWSLKNNIMEDYTNIPKEIRKQILSTIPIVSAIPTLPELKDLPKQNIPNNELVEMSHDFYKWLAIPKYLKFFEKNTNPKKQFLQIITPQDIGPFYGCMFPFYYPTPTSYFLIYKTQTITDFITLNHEIAHGIFFKTENNLLSDLQFFLREVEGYFFDFLSLQYLKEKKIIKKAVEKQIEYENITIALDNLLEFYIKYFYVILRSHKKKANLENMYTKMIENDLFHLTNENDLTKLEDNTENTAIYAYSFLIANTLEKEYKMDPEHAFYLLENYRKDRITPPPFQITNQDLKEKIRKLKL